MAGIKAVYESDVAFGDFTEHRAEQKVHEAKIRARSGEA